MIAPRTTAGQAHVLDPNAHNPQCRFWSLGMDLSCDCSLGLRILAIETEAVADEGLREAAQAVVDSWDCILPLSYSEQEAHAEAIITLSATLAKKTK